MEGYQLLYNQLLQNKVLLKEHELYSALEEQCEALLPMTLDQFIQERIIICEAWYSNFRSKPVKAQVNGVLHQGIFSILVSAEKSIYRL